MDFNYKGFYAKWCIDEFEIFDCNGGDLIDAGFKNKGEVMDYIDRYMVN